MQVPTQTRTLNPEKSENKNSKKKRELEKDQKKNTKVEKRSWHILMKLILVATTYFWHSVVVRVYILLFFYIAQQKHSIINI